VSELTTIRRLLIVGSDEFATRGIDGTASAFGMLVRQVPAGGDIAPALEGFGPDAVILDAAAFDSSLHDLLRAVADTGADLLLLGRPDDPAVRTARDLAVTNGLTVAGILAKPIAPEGLEAALRALSGEQVYTAADIAAAVMRGEITAWYQPQLRRQADGWRADGAETLARWQHPEHGVVLPDAFVPVAEAEGQIAAITDCVLQSSMQQLGVWHRAGMPLRVGVNLSPSLVTDPDFPERLARLVIEYDVAARYLVLEIPESGLAESPPGFLAMLARLRIHGFGLALEHFGSGTSSLADLYRTPFSELKIDRRLVSLLDEDEDARSLVRGIVALAHELGLETTAEAVESQESLDFLHSAGCDRVQGFVISRPLPATAFQTAVPRWR
jgi:EAL domain-containing protein (putative c-di-GMP-specific phosphodiesterase class I)